MGFFHKSKPKTELEKPANIQPDDEARPSEILMSSPVKALRQAYREQCGNEMPDEMLSLFKQMVKAEAQQGGINADRLSRQELQRIKESLQLCETKRNNVRQALEKTQFQLGWYKDFIRLTRELNDGKTKLYDIQKELASSFSESQLLERYDALSPVQEPYFRVVAQNEEVEKEKLQEDDLTSQIDKQKALITQYEQQAEDSRKLRENAEQELERQLGSLQSGFQLIGQGMQLQKNIQRQNRATDELRANLAERRKEAEEYASQLQQFQSEKKACSQALQAVEAHVPMLQHGEKLIVKIERLGELHDEMTQCQHELDDSQKRQADSNEMLNRLYRENSENDDAIQTAKHELLVHQQNNQGFNGYNLQQRASELNIQLHTLKTAQHVWARLAENYNFIEAKEQKVIRLQLRFDQNTDTLANLEQIVAKLHSICDEQKYAYTLSKSENVATLRRDLREGTACSVCGATHHPYHSETEVALGELIKDLKKDYEQTSSELKTKEAKLIALRKEHALEEGQLVKEREALQTARIQLDRDKTEWADFSSLGPSLSDCSHNVNRETRKIMIQQLIEKATQDAEEARQNLESFNFHQTNINRIVEQVDKLESARQDYINHLNEVNTACQVLANNVEQSQKTLNIVSTAYSRLYEEIESQITLPLWHSEWKASREALVLKIQGMMEEWQKNSQALIDIEREENKLTIKTKVLNDYVAQIDQQLLLSIQEQEALNEEAGNLQAEQLRDLGDQTPENLFQHYMISIAQLGKTEREKRLQLFDAKEILTRLEDEQEVRIESRQYNEQKLANLKYKLDLWLHKFNSANPPAQTSELQRLFVSERDWEERRKHLRELQDRVLILQHDVDKAREALVAHQALSLRPAEQNDESRDALLFRKEELEAQLEELSTQRATLVARLQANDRALERMSILETEDKGS